ncbi:MAG: type II toxin-antitoxin system RelE/ParE family toxin [Tepidisphaeraceae bacterium]|jgi:plasmid stabilization system protein ParE
MPDAYRVIISPEAAANLLALHAFIAQNSPANAAKMVDRILAAVETLKTVPHRTVLEHQSPRIQHPVRSLPVSPYVVFFRVLNDDRVVRILTIRHGARRRPRRFE